MFIYQGHMKRNIINYKLIQILLLEDHELFSSGLIKDNTYFSKKARAALERADNFYSELLSPREEQILKA